ncbi:hypothetical protein, partial [Vibrio harveyi]
MPKYDGKEFLLNIDMSKWSQQKVTSFKLTKNKVLGEAKEHYIQQKRKRKNATHFAYAFFVNYAPSKRPGVFASNHFEFISLRYLEQLNLPANYRGIKFSEVSEV